MTLHNSIPYPNFATMEEEMKEAEKLLVIENEMKRYNKLLAAASDKILNSKASEYPIFVVAKQPIALGFNLVDREKVNSNWSINVSSLEEFTANNLVFKEKVIEFKKTYKDPKQFICLFVLSDLGAQFLFVPRELK